jgi:hypothetical protein
MNACVERLRSTSKLGPMLWQLPPKFQRDDDLLATALETLTPGRHAFEFRDASWFAEETPLPSSSHSCRTSSAHCSFETWAGRFVASRMDVAENTRKMYRSHLRKAGETFSDRDPFSISASDVAEWVAVQTAERKAGTVRQYVDCLRVFLDFVGVEPNPARDPRVKLPKSDTEEVVPPSDEHYLAILDKLLPRWRLLVITMEQGALRPGEAIGLRWGDVDASASRLRLSASPPLARRPDALGGSSFPSGSRTQSRGRARSRTGLTSARCSRGSTIRRRARPCHGPAGSRRSPPTRFTGCATAESRSGTTRASR